MAKTYFFKRALASFEPIGDESEAFHKRKKIGSIVEMHVKGGRSVAFNAKLHVLEKEIFANQDAFDNFCLFQGWLRMKIGKAYTQVFSDGSTLIVPQSPTFDSVTTDDELDDEWFRPMIDVGLSILNGTTDDEMRSQVERIIGFA